METFWRHKRFIRCLRGTWVVISFGTRWAFSITVGKLVVFSRDLDIDLAILIF